ncbi:uncharacterized protein LOC132194533 isoform X2 [Neocloeon triangulifer]|uniref:uncharacterized protein LOC132194533 isoform X2 n=1 Tax=Neocloeon triangulifer TaxID=2078957 RepID=UPI00286EBD24|nr:uncharacterized protein LOC132194533 isoform X2 [Neocloeon triangulifer]
MPSSNPVYQPTTVSYEQQGSEWPGGGYLSQTVASGFSRTQCLQWMVLVLGLFSVAAGLMMAIEGSIDYRATKNVPVLENETSGDLTIAICGAVLLFVGILLLLGYTSVLRRHRGGCFCCGDKDLVRQLRDGNNAQILTLGPTSTDTLVTAQYGPVSEIAYQPPTINDEEETRKLMEHKETSEENERMMDQDPRIVLRPLCAASEQEQN